MGYSMTHELELEQEHYLLHDAIEAEFIKATDCRDLFKDWVKMSPSRRSTAGVRVSTRHPGVRITLNMVGSDSAKWSESYLDGEVVEEDQEEGVSGKALREIRDKVTEIEGKHAISENIDRTDFNLLLGLIRRL